MQLLKKVLTIHHLIAVMISLFLFMILSFLLRTPINKIFSNILFQSDFGQSLLAIDANLTNKILLPIIDIFLILQTTTPSFLVSKGLGEYSGEIAFGFTIFIFISSVPFIVSGFYLAKRKISLKSAIPSFTVLYTFVILLLTLIYENTISSSSIQFNLHYNIEITTLLFISFICSYIGYQTHHRFSKKTNKSILSKSLNLALKATATNVLLYFSIISVFIVGAFGMLKERLMYMFPSLPITEWFNLSIQLLSSLSAQISAYLLGLVHLLPITISINENDTVNNATFSISNGMFLNGEVSIGTYSLFIVRDLLNKVPYDEYLVYLLIIPSIILIITGYRSKMDTFQWKAIISFSLFYALLVGFVVSTSTIQWNYADVMTDSMYQLTLSFEYIKLFISSFSFALLGFTIGQVLKRMTTKKERA